MMSSDKTVVTRVERADTAPARLFRTRYVLYVLEGPDKGRSLTTANEQITIGSADQNDLVLHDSAVSRHHLRIELSPEGFVLTDLNSTNGTTLGSVRLHEAVAHGTVDLHLGETRLRLAPSREEEEIELASSDRFGTVLGQAPAMRELFRKLNAVATSDVTVLLEGETGTGKEMIAREIHEHSNRRDKPFIIIDCGAIPASLIESELFGHERGAFTGAVNARLGAFEEAEGGTILLDEIGELELSMQPRLLRVLEQREIKRVGHARHKPVNVRVIAATNRDLRRDINEGTFRPDLFYRLAVVHLRIPSLRLRPEDIPLLVNELLPRIAGNTGGSVPKLTNEVWQQIVKHPWRGNVRELRNFLERMVALSDDAGPISPQMDLSLELGDEDYPALGKLEALPFKEAKARWVESFDVAYLTRLLERCTFNVAEAARQSGIDRVHLFRLVKKYKLRERKRAIRNASAAAISAFSA